MSLRLIQMLTPRGERVVAVAADGARMRRVCGVSSVVELARGAIAAGTTLAAAVQQAGYGEEIDVGAALGEQRVLAPVDHPDGARILLSGTGLTHLGSADARDRMHARAQGQDASDSLKMFRLGVEGGKPPPGETGVQPEWFYKGDGRSIVGPEQPLAMPAFALDGGEEAELAGIYLIADDGTPYRLGFTLANEFSDHVTERMNYLYLAHSKLRPAALGPELLVGALPANIRGAVRIRRGGEILWERVFLTGEANMSHSLRNLEHHHFKYGQFRRAGDLHVHFFGTATLSFADGVRPQAGDVFEIEAPPFTLPLRNPLVVAAPSATSVRVL
ncbi:MAG TPA: AraD1 family protein [Steroidobacteraceae bacterium]|nr:AraD1 family protein [Steroidobacteraceae bacterium]